MCCCFSCCSAVLIPSQGLLSVPCSASQPVHKKLGGSMTRTADPKWPEGYSIPWNIRLCTPAGGIGQEGLITAQELAGHRSADGEHCIVHHLFLWGFTFLSPFCDSCCYCCYYTVFCIHYWTVSISTQEFYVFFWFSPPSHRRENKQVSHVILSCQTGLNHNIWEVIYKSQDV